MKLAVEMVDDITIVQIRGSVDSRACGEILDTLAGVLKAGTTKLVVDVSGVTELKRAAIRGFVVAAKIAAHRKAQMRICGATGDVAMVLRGVGHGYLLRLDPVIEISILALAGEARYADTQGPANKGETLRIAA